MGEFYKVIQAEPCIHIEAVGKMLGASFHLDLGNRIHIKTHDNREYDGVFYYINACECDGEIDTISIRCGDEAVRLRLDEIAQIEV